MFIHPSRGRPAMAREAFDNITSTMRSGTPFNYYLSIDNDDPVCQEYCETFHGTPTVILVNDNPHEVVDATNRAAEKLDDEDLIFANTDDYRWQVGWDVPLLEFLKALPEMALVNYPEYNPTIAVPQILTAALYRRLGYVFWPEYISMYADNDILEAARALGCDYDLRPITFCHIHPDFKRRPMDETTARTNEACKMELGKRLLEKRRSEGFNL